MTIVLSKGRQLRQEGLVALMLQNETVEVDAACVSLQRAYRSHTFITEHHVVYRSKNGLVLNKVQQDLLLGFVGHLFELLLCLKDLVDGTLSSSG